jgi:hypothetical protein
LIVSIEKFLKQRAVNIAVDGCYTLRRWYDPEGKLRTFACRTTRVSPFRMILKASAVGRIGDRLTSYFKDFGEFDGDIIDTMQGGFLIKLEMTRERRVWIAEKLAWLEQKEKDPSVQDVRNDARIVPRVPHSTLTLVDGSAHPCFIIDVCSAGVAVLAEFEPPLGMPIAIGSVVGRVIRHFPNGFAVKFVEKQNIDDVMRLIVRDGPTIERWSVSESDAELLQPSTILGRDDLQAGEFAPEL